MSNRPRIYLGNIPFSTTEEDIRAFFGGYNVVDVRIISDRETGRPRGFAFVTLGSHDEVKRASEQLHQKELGGRRALVNVAQEKTAGGGPKRDYKDAWK